jgi:hypothetical protein
MTDTISHLPVAGIEWFASIAAFRKEAIDTTMMHVTRQLEPFMATVSRPVRLPALPWPRVRSTLQGLREDGRSTRTLVLEIEPFLILYVIGRREIGTSGECMLFGVCCYPKEFPDAVRSEVFISGPDLQGNAAIAPVSCAGSPQGQASTVSVRNIRGLRWAPLMNCGNGNRRRIAWVREQ